MKDIELIDSQVVHHEFDLLGTAPLNLFAVSIGIWGAISVVILWDELWTSRVAHRLLLDFACA
jgi:hypothetical protein